MSGAATASVWNIGIVGATVGLGNYDIALVLGVLNLVTLRFLLRAKGRGACAAEKDGA